MADVSNSSWAEFRKKWLVPSIIAVVSMIASQLMLFSLEAAPELQFTYCGGYIFVLLAGSRTFGFVFIYRVMVPLCFGILMVFLYKTLHESQFTAGLLGVSSANFKYLELLFDILATLYAICTAFLLWKGLTDHDQLRQMLSDEANHIERLIGYLRYFDLSKKENHQFAMGLRRNFARYIGNIVDGDEVRVSLENSVIIRSSTDILAKFKPKDDNDRIALAETMKGLSDLTMARSKRISQMEISMSPYLLISLGIMSLAILYPFFTEKPNLITISCVMILGSLLSFLLVTLLDISRPFNGFWKIKTESFEAITEILQQEIDEGELAFVETNEKLITDG